MFGWLKRIEMGTTTYHDVRTAAFWLTAMLVGGCATGALLMWLTR